MDKIPMTVNGYQTLQRELDRLKHTERPSIIQAISDARELGDLSENAEYHAARERQSFIEGRISELEDKVARANVIDLSKLTGETVKFGARVKLVDDDTQEESQYQIVGADEADIEQGLLSIASPLARALIGKGKNDSIEFSTPRGKKFYEILEVSFS